MEKIKIENKDKSIYSFFYYLVKEKKKKENNNFSFFLFDCVKNEKK